MGIRSLYKFTMTCSMACVNLAKATALSSNSIF